MKSLDRYLFREVFVPTLVALVALTFMLVGRELGTLLELIVRRSVSAEEIWALIAALIPGAMTFTIPVAVLVGVLSGFGRLSSDSECIAFRASGISIRQILGPVLALGVLAWIANLTLSVWIAPRTAARLSELTHSIALMRHLPLELQPRVFNEDLEGLVLYVRDMSPDARRWSGVFLANVSDPAQLNVTWAEAARLTCSPDDTRCEITLRRGSTEIVPLNAPDRFISSAFETTTIPLPAPEGPIQLEAATPQQIPTRELFDQIQDGQAGFAEQVELHRRIALPFACIAFALIGLPLGLSTRRGGRSVGLVLSAILMLVYYTIFIGGTGTAAGTRELSPAIGTWMANLSFTLLGIILLLRSEKVSRSRILEGILDSADRLRQRMARKPAERKRNRLTYPLTHHSTWFRTLDLYVIRGFAFFFVLVVVAFVSLVVVVTLFELLPDIVESGATVNLIAAYFLYYMPQILYLVVPLAVLVAAFVILGSLTRSNETLAIRAGAISLYRMAWPLVAVAAILSAGIYLMGDYMLPYTNQKQDAYRDTIKGRAPQTYFDPLRKWMAGSEGQIYFYGYFDPEQNTFAGLSVFEFDPGGVGLERWTFASRASRRGNRWTFENGWTRPIGETGTEAYRSFGELESDPAMDGPEFFKREVRIASQMNYPELRRHIAELRRAGFDVGRLTVDLYTKLSFPLVSVIMAIIAIPFALSTGRRGAFYGIGIAIVIGISYWATFEIFGKLGAMSQLSPAIAAWFPNLIFGFGGIWMLLKVRT